MRDWFADPGNASLAAFAVALLSLVASAVAVLVSWRTSRRQTDIMEAQERDRQRAAKRADLRARHDEDLSSLGNTRYWLVIENEGASAARNIVVWADGVPIGEHPSYFAGELTLLAPRAEYRYGLAPSLSVDVPRRVRITWEDDSGEPGEWESQL